jgi:hypothetical protein
MAEIGWTLAVSNNPTLSAPVSRCAFIRLFSLARIALLIIDNFGLKPLRPPAGEDLRDLIAGRYETASTIVTSNLDLAEWDQAFPANRLLASATLDRLRHTPIAWYSTVSRFAPRTGRCQSTSCHNPETAQA